MVTNTNRQETDDPEQKSRWEATQRREPSHWRQHSSRPERAGGGSVSEGAPGRAGLGKEGPEAPARPEAAGEPRRRQPASTRTPPASGAAGRRAGRYAPGGTAACPLAAGKLPAVMKATKKNRAWHLPSVGNGFVSCEVPAITLGVTAEEPTSTSEASAEKKSMERVRRGSPSDRLVTPQVPTRARR